MDNRRNGSSIKYPKSLKWLPKPNNRRQTDFANATPLRLSPVGRKYIRERINMSVAYYIVLDNTEPGFDTFVNGKSIANETVKIDAICEKLGIQKLDDFISMSEDDISDMLGEDIDLPESAGEQWFSADEGIAFVTAVISHIRSNPKDVMNAEDVLGDFEEYAEIFKKTKEIGAKWHLYLDI